MKVGDTPHLHIFCSRKMTADERTSQRMPVKVPKVTTGDDNTADFGMTSENNRALALRPFAPFPFPP